MNIVISLKARSRSTRSVKAVLLVLAICSFYVSCSENVDGPTQCPTWFVPDSTGNRCQCGSATAGVECHQGSKQVVLFAHHCVTYDESRQQATAGVCPYNLLTPLYSSVELPQNVTQLNMFMCGGLNQTGVLCSNCEPGLGPSLLSYEVKCLKCLDGVRGWLLFICLACVPATILFFILLFFQVHATSAPMNCFILLAQVYYFILEQTQWIFVHKHARSLQRAVDINAKIVGTFYDVWMLDFFWLFIPPFCAGSRTTVLHVLALEYIVAVYQLALVAVVYVCVQQHAKGSRVLACMWVPFKVCLARVERVWDPSRSLVQVFATFLVLAYYRITIVSASLLLYTELYNDRDITTGQYNLKMTYYNASVPYFGSEHAPLGVLAVFMIVVFNLLPMVFLFLYPSRIFQSCLNYCKIRSHALHTFADTFNGCFKNGCGGTRDRRWFAGFDMLLLIAFLLLAWVPLITLCITLLCTASSFFVLLVRPYKDDFFSFLDFFFFLGVGIAGATGIISKEISGTLSQSVCLVAVAPALYFAFYVTARVVLCVRILDKYQCCQRLKGMLERVTDYGVPRWPDGSGAVQARSPVSARYGAI